MFRGISWHLKLSLECGKFYNALPRNGGFNAEANGAEHKDPS